MYKYVCVKQIFREGKLYNPGDSIITQAPIAPPKEGRQPHFKLVEEMKAPVGRPPKDKPEGGGTGGNPGQTGPTALTGNAPAAPGKP